MRSYYRTLIAVLVVVLAACGGGAPRVESPTDSNPLGSEYIELRTPSGETVECFWFKSGYGGGLSCNWDGIPPNGSDG